MLIRRLYRRLVTLHIPSIAGRYSNPSRLSIAKISLDEKTQWKRVEDSENWHFYFRLANGEQNTRAEPTFFRQVRALLKTAHSSACAFHVKILALANHEESPRFLDT